MNAFRKPLVVVAALLAGGLFAASANATTITYDFTVTATSGPLSGTVSHGTFSYDSSSVTPGARNNATGLLTSLDFTWNGTTYDASTANTGDLGFDAAGRLTHFVFGDNCDAGICNVVPDVDQWFAASSVFGYSADLVLGQGDVTFAPAVASVPEPPTLAMFGLGLLLLGCFAALRRRTAQAAVRSVV